MSTREFVGWKSRTPVQPPGAPHLRSGMFVCDAGRVGILTHRRTLRDPLNPQWGLVDQWELHYLGSDGATLLAVPLEVERGLDWLRQARLDEIPEARRPQTRAAEAFGYR